MKTTTFFTKFQIILMIGCFFTGSVFAGNINLKENGSTKFKINQSTYTELSFNNSISDIEFVPIKTKEGYFSLLKIADYSYSMLAGEPQLPTLKKIIEVPVNASYEVEILSSDFSEINLYQFGIEYPMLPAQPSLSKSCDNPEDEDFIYNKSSYMVDGYLGTEIVKIVDLGVMRGVRLARVEISPVSYNPVQNMLKVYENIEVRINFTGGDVAATLQQKKDKFSPYFESNYNHISNYKPVDSKELIMDAPVTYIIVSDPMFEDALQPFIEWKTKKGFYVVEAYTNNPNVGTSTSSIQSYLEDFYNNPPTGYNSQSFVLIVGDVAQVPAFNGTSGGHVTDLYYHEYTGDLYPECYYGRFSATNLAQLQPQIDKTLEYEQYLFPDPSFLDEVVMVAGADGGFQTHSNGQINYGTTYYFNVAHGITSHTYLQPEPGGAGYSASIRQNVSDGVAFGNYTAHCSPSGWADPSFTSNHISALTNAHKYPLLVGNCCQSVQFQDNSFGEELLRAADKGAVGYIGGSNSTYWDEDFWWGVGAEPVNLNPTYLPDHTGAYDGAFHDMGEPLEQWYITQGQMVQAGNMAVTQAGSSMETYYWEIYHLMGDPSLMIYFGQGDEPTANFAGLMPPGSATFTVNTDPYSYIAISKDGILAGAAIADEAGLAEVEMFNPITVPGMADMVITGQNMQPYIGTVTVASPEGAYVLFNEYELDDSQGNNNGMADFDEYLMLDVTLENFGNQMGTNLVATISTDDEYITIDSGTKNWPDIPGGSTSLESAAFALTVDNIIEDQHTAMFDIEITDGTDTWTSSFNMVLNAPVLSVGSYMVDDSQGNNNGRLDPGETANIIVTNENEGGCDALESIASTFTSSPLITLNNSTYEIGTIATGEIQNAIFNITIDASAQVGEVAEVQYTLESTPYMANSLLNLSIGLIVEDFESGDFSMFGWEFSGNADWAINTSDPYEGVYSAKSGTISHEQESTLLLTADVATDDQISFFFKVSSENNYDYLRFYIDGVQKGEWAGEVSWTETSYDVTAGNHTFKWAYEKDYSVSTGSDCAWVDFIVFPAIGGAAPLGVIASASPNEICEGEDTQLNAFAMGGNGSYTYDWQPTTGLSDPTIANPIASVDATTTYTVFVDDGDNTITDEIIITVNPTPEMPTISQSGAVIISSATDGNQWYDSNGMIEGATNQTYTPDLTEDYYVIVTSEFGCESEASSTYHFIYTGVIDIEAGQHVNVYPNPFTQKFTVDYSLATPSSVRFTIYNLHGQLITVVDDGVSKTTGNHRIIFDANKFNTGLYYIKIETSDYSIVKQIFRSK